MTRHNANQLKAWLASNKATAHSPPKLLQGSTKDLNMLDFKLIDYCHYRNILVFAYTLDNKKKLNQATDHTVQNLKKNNYLISL